MDAGVSFTAIEQGHLTDGLVGPGASTPMGANAALTQPGRASDPIPALPANAAFRLSWSIEDGKYHMESPLVVGPEGDEISCGTPSELENGKKYYCVVKLVGGRYEAAVNSEDELDESESESESESEEEVDAEWRVPLFKVPPADYEEAHADPDSGRQYHLGAVVVGGAGGGDCTWKDPV